METLTVDRQENWGIKFNHKNVLHSAVTHRTEMKHLNEAFQDCKEDEITLSLDSIFDTDIKEESKPQEIKSRVTNLVNENTEKIESFENKWKSKCKALRCTELYWNENDELKSGFDKSNQTE